MLKEQQYKDHCLIIVGPGNDADATLAKRRIKAGGRLAHFLTQGPHDPRVKIMAFEDEDLILAWQPPLPKARVSAFGRRFGAYPRTYWTKVGPEAIELNEGQHLIIGRLEGELRHVSLLDSEQHVQVQMSGYVVLNPSPELAESLDVEVEDEQMRPFGTYSVRWVLLSSLLIFLWQVARWTFSIVHERAANEGQIPWWRCVICCINCLFGQWAFYDTFGIAMSGGKMTRSTSWIGLFVAAIWICSMVVYTAVQIRVAEFALNYVGYIAIVGTHPFLLYCFTRYKYTTRRFWPSLQWACVLAMTTIGLVAVNMTLAMGHLTLISVGQVVAGSVLFPLGTALVEFGSVNYVGHAYHSMITVRRASGDFSVQGDQLQLVATGMVLFAHVSAEATRLGANFASAVMTGNYSWIGTVASTLTLNILIRLGWFRLALFYTLRAVAGSRLAVAVLAPTSWTMIHDEIKVYGGYFRFIPVGGLAVARVMLRCGQPVFNTSATWALVIMFCMEILEDAVVVRELLPMAPVPSQLFERDVKGKNGDPGQLLAVECRADIGADQDAWRTCELTNYVRRFSFTKQHPIPGMCLGSETMEQRIALGPRDDTAWGRVRAWLGQPRAVVPAVSLNGLREIPFLIQFSIVSAMAEYSTGILSVLIGAGYLRGLRGETCDSFGLVLGILFWDVPLSC